MYAHYKSQSAKLSNPFDMLPSSLAAVCVYAPTSTLHIKAATRRVEPMRAMLYLRIGRTRGRCSDGDYEGDGTANVYGAWVGHE